MTDEVVPPPADTTVIEGGPDTTQQQPAGFKFKYGGREFNTEAELEGYLNDISTEVTRLKSTPVAPPPVAEPPRQQSQPSGKKTYAEMNNDELVAEILSNPRGVFDAIRNDTQQAIVSSDQSRRNIENMWNEVWTKNPELKKFEPMVKMVFDANLQTLGPMKLADVPGKLAELSRSAILTVNKEAFKAEKRHDPGSRAIIEGANTSTQTRQPADVEANKVTSLSGVLKNRAAARRAKSTQVA